MARCSGLERQKIMLVDGVDYVPVACMSSIDEGGRLSPVLSELLPRVAAETSRAHAAHSCAVASNADRGMWRMQGEGDVDDAVLEFELLA